MIGVVNILYDNRENDVRQYYRELRSHFDRSGLSYKNFVIDNSKTGLKNLLPQDSACSHFPENIGYTRACNLLMAQAFKAGCDVVVATNVDGFLLPGCMANMLATLDRNNGNALVEARQFPHEHPRPYDPCTGATDWVSGCCLLIARSTYERLGPLDERMFLYCEDVDYSFRARLAGIPCVVSSEAHFYHRGDIWRTDKLRRKHHLLSSRYLAIKWRNPETQKMMEDALLTEGFFTCSNELPAIPADMQTYSGIHWDPQDRMGFAPMRWKV